MEDQLKRFIEDFRNTNYHNYDEQKTKQGIILRILYILGWNTFDPDEVCAEFQITNGRVDYALKINNKILLFIEVKNVGVPLKVHEEQLLRYSFEKGIELALLTNGIDWWFYLPLRPGNWPDRRFIEVKITDNSDIATKHLVELLLRDNILSGKAKSYAESIYYELQKNKETIKELPRAFIKLISEPNELLVDLINEEISRVLGYTIDTNYIKNFLTTIKCNITYDNPQNADSDNFERENRLRMDQDKKTKTVTKRTPDERVRFVSENTDSRKRFPPLSLKESFIPIIDLLKEKHGEIEADVAYNILYQKFSHVFKHSDSNWNISDGSVERWRHYFATAKAILVKRGFIEGSDTAKKGLWILTQRGWNYK